MERTREYQPVQFRPLELLRNGGTQRGFVLLWLLACLIIMPSGMLTRIYELTGIPIGIFGLEVHITIYLPLILCIPIALIFGYLWAAIPAYVSSFLVGTLGDMPILWNAVFAFSNPVTLAILVMVYRLVPIRVDLGTLFSLLCYIMINLLAALAGSAGAFIWAHTNNIGFSNVYPVWQGWWIGGFLQSVLFSLPIILLCSRPLIRYKNSLIQSRDAQPLKGWQIVAAISSITIVLLSFIWVAFELTARRLIDLSAQMTDPTLIAEFDRALGEVFYPVWVLGLVILFVAYFSSRIVVYWTEQLRELNDALADRNMRLHTLSTTDQLTGIPNRRSLFVFLESAFKQLARSGTGFGVIMIDLDHFKRLNDDHGHGGGDLALSKAAEFIRQQVPAMGITGRYGGEEFCVVLPGADIAETEHYAERLRGGLESLEVIYKGERLSLTASFGCTVSDAEDSLLSDILSRADRALYEAKSSGRNRVCTLLS